MVLAISYYAVIQADMIAPLFHASLLYAFIFKNDNKSNEFR